MILGTRIPLTILGLALTALGLTPTAWTSAQAAGFELPHESAVPGGVKIIRLDAAGAAIPYVDSDGNRALVVQDGSTWVAVIGIPLSAPLGRHQVVVHQNEARQEIEFTVGDKRYASQSLKVAPRHVDLSAADLARVTREKIRIDHALSHWTEAAPESLLMPPPVPGIRSSSFGLRRIFNGESRAPQSGMDIAAATGTGVLLPIAGTVVDTGDYFVTGNTVNLGGLYTWFHSLDGEFLRAGDRVIHLSAERGYTTQKEGTGQVGAIAIYQSPDVA